MSERRMKTVYLFSTKQNLVPFEGISSINSFFQLWDFFGSGILGGISGAVRPYTPAKMVANNFVRTPGRHLPLESLPSSWLVFQPPNMKKRCAAVKLEIILGAPSFCWQVKIVT